MAIKHQLALGPMPVEALSLERESALPTDQEIALPSTGEKVSLTTLLAIACRATGLQEKTAAIAQGYAPNYWPRIKNGEKRAYLDPVDDLPAETVEKFLTLWAAQCGLRVVRADRRRLALANVARALGAALEEIA